MTLKISCAAVALVTAVWSGVSPALVADVTVTNPGTGKKNKTIHCGGVEGTISVATGVQFTTTNTQRPAPQVEVEVIYRFGNALGLAYKGANCAGCKWLQFIWREIQATTASGTQPVSGNMPTVNGTLPLTTDPSKPDYFVDSGEPGNPYTNNPMNSTVTGDTNSVYDQPGPGFPSNLKKNAGITKMTSIAHFDSFLVCDGKICAKVSWTVTYRWTPADGETGPEYDASEPEEPGTANDAQKKAFEKQFPGHAFPK